MNPELLLENYNQLATTLTTSAIIFSLAFALLLSVIMYLTFKHCRQEINYDRNFNITLVMIAFLMTLIMLSLQKNIALSIGMLGSLSIVRFRANAKDPRDLGFVFWAMAIGLVSATQNWPLGLLGSVIVAALLLLSGDHQKRGNTMLVVIRGSQADSEVIDQIVRKDAANARVKAQNMLADSFELVYELKADHATEQRILQALIALDGIDSVNMLAPSAEVY